MTSFRQLEHKVTLGDKEAIIGLFDPDGDVSVEKGTMGPGSVVYGYRMLLTDGSIGLLSGGARLDAALRAKVSGDKPLKVKITAFGAPRTLERTYVVEVVR